MSKSRPTIAAPDLTQRPPRSPRSRLGGYALLPRMLDKGRATLGEKNGKYNYNCGTDQHLVRFLGFDPEAEQPKVHNQHRAADYRQREQVDRLDDRERPRRRADRMAER